MAMSFFYMSMKLISLSEANTLIQLGPIFTGIFASILLKEPFTKYEFYCAICCFLGYL